MSAAIQAYLQRKAELEKNALPRARCHKCKKPEITCYCAELRPFESHPRIVILMHPLEFKHPIGTGRLAHNCLANSKLWVGADFANSKKLASLLNDPGILPTLLFPNQGSSDLSTMALAERQSFFSSDKQSVLIILDATWHLAKKMLYRTPELQKIPRVCFTPKELSRFIVRKQPNPQCYSTIEAVHEVLQLLSDPTTPAAHEHLLEVFQKMIAKQLSFNNHQRPSRHKKSYIQRKEKRALKRAQNAPLHNLNKA